MKKLAFTIVSLVFVLLTNIISAQTTAVYKSTATATADQITGNLVIGTGKTLTTTGTGTITANGISSMTSAALRAAITDESGTGALLFAGGDIGAATGTSLALSGNLSSSGATSSLTLGAATETLTVAVTAAGAGTITSKSGQVITLATGTAGITASGTGTHTFGTTNTVTMAAGALTATNNAAGGIYTVTLTNQAGSGDIGGHVLYLNASRSDTANTRLIGSLGDKFTVFSEGSVSAAGNLTVSGTGASSVGGTFAIGGTSAITGVRTATAALDFGEIAAAASADLTITVTGAATGQSVSLGLVAAPTAGIIYQGFVSAINTVTVRATNITAAPVNPASETIRATVISF